MNVRNLLQSKTKIWMVFLGVVIMLGQLPLAEANATSRINPLKQEISLLEAIHHISERYQVLFNYDRAIVSDIQVQYQPEASQNVDDAITAVLENTDLKYQMFNERYVVIYKNDQEGIESLKEMIHHFQKIVDDKDKKVTTMRQTRSVPRLTSRSLAKAIVPIVFSVEGTVTDQEGEPLIGVNIQVKGTNTGTATDFEGNFTLEDIDENAVLVVSYVGYQMQEVAVAGKSTVDIVMLIDAQKLDELIVVGYGTVKKSDLTGSVERVNGQDFENQSFTQLTEMLSGTVAGFISNQGTSASGGSSMQIRGPNSLTASTAPMIVLDGAIFNGSIQDINPNDIETIDILKDASSAAIYGSRAASGVILVSTKKGEIGKPKINFVTKIGSTGNYNKRRGLGSEEYIQFRTDYYRQAFSDRDDEYYTQPSELNEITLEEWFNLSDAPLPDAEREWMSRLSFTSVEQENYLKDKTIDAYDYIYRNGLRQDYDLSLSGATDFASYYWSLGYLNNEGIKLGDQYAAVRSRLNVNFIISDWLNVGINAQFSDKGTNSVPVSNNVFYQISPFGQFFEDNGFLKPLPHGNYTENPLIDYYRTSLSDKTNSLFSNLHAEVKLPFGIVYKISYQPNYSANNYLQFTKISDELGGQSGEIPSGTRRNSNSFNWVFDNILSWNKEFGPHKFDVTLLANLEKNKYWYNSQTSRDFKPNQELIYHGLQFGVSPTLDNADSKSTADALMARLNYNFSEKYLLTASIRRDGYSAFGKENPRATFPSVAAAWNISNEKFFNSEFVDRLKIRLSWGANGNRDIGNYAALASMGASLWYDGSNTRVGVNTTSLANYGLRWEKTTSLNLGFEIGIIENRLNFNVDLYDMKTTDLLVDRQIPKITGFSNITSNIGELQNRGIEMTMNSFNINKQDFTWRSNLVFSFNRNKINKLFGDISSYTILGIEKEGDVPDFSNKWFPGQSIDVVWDYQVNGIWQLDELEEANKYNLKPGDYKVTDVDKDYRYVDLEDKKFIGFSSPQYRIGFMNEFEFFRNFTGSIFVRADLGHIGSFRDAMNAGYGIYDRVNRPSGNIPYWTPQNANSEYPGLTPNYEGFGGSILIYKPRSFIRIQDVSISYNLSSLISNFRSIDHIHVFGSVRNLLTFTKWPGWDPESGMSPMPRIFTIGLNCTL